MKQPKNSLLGDVSQIGRGFVMGCADAVPGVSGGTMALLLGIYERLVAAISHFDLTLLAYLRQRRWGEAARHCDLRFLIFLGIGIVVGIGGLASIMKDLLTEDPENPGHTIVVLRTMGAFFGLIVASSIVVVRKIDWLKSAGGLIGRLSLMVAGGAFAYWLVGQPALGELEGAKLYPYLFFCGMVAICAMILPGISGAFILLVLGQYHHMIGIVKGAVHGEITSEAILSVTSFGAGAVLGLMVFSRFLRWLLARFHGLTLALLCGFMIGSLRLIWPWKEWIDKDANQYNNVMPTLDGGAISVIAIAIAACVFVLVLEWLGERVAGEEKSEVV